MFIYITSVFCCILLACVADKLNKRAEVLPFAIVFFDFIHNIWIPIWSWNRLFFYICSNLYTDI